MDEGVGVGGQRGCEGSAQWGVRGLLFDASEDRGQDGRDAIRARYHIQTATVQEGVCASAPRCLDVRIHLSIFVFRMCMEGS